MCLVPVSAHNKNGKVYNSFDITKPIGISIIYKVLKPHKWFSCFVDIKDSSYISLFTSLEDADQNLKLIPKQQGLYKSTCWIPGNLLTEGLFSVRILVSTPGEKSKIIDLQDAISFYVHDELRGNSVQGKLTKPLKGVIRPKLAWERVKIGRLLFKNSAYDN